MFIFSFCFQLQASQIIVHCFCTCLKFSVDLLCFTWAEAPLQHYTVSVLLSSENEQVGAKYMCMSKTVSELELGTTSHLQCKQ